MGISAQRHRAHPVSEVVPIQSIIWTINLGQSVQPCWDPDKRQNKRQNKRQVRFLCCERTAQITLYSIARAVPCRAVQLLALKSGTPVCDVSCIMPATLKSILTHCLSALFESQVPKRGRCATYCTIYHQAVKGRHSVT